MSDPSAEPGPDRPFGGLVLGFIGGRLLPAGSETPCPPGGLDLGFFGSPRPVDGRLARSPTDKGSSGSFAAETGGVSGAAAESSAGSSLQPD